MTTLAIIFGCIGALVVALVLVYLYNFRVLDLDRLPFQPDPPPAHLADISVLAVAAIAITPGCFSRRSTEIA